MTKEWKEYLEVVAEASTEGSYQASQRKKIRAFKNDMYQGDQNNTAPYLRPPPKQGKSGLGPLEEELPLVPEIKEDLNRNIWLADNKLDPEIAKNLLQIARDFYESLDLSAPILDITLTGSIANYNWTKKSDIDLHILINYDAENEDIELVRKFLSQAKTNWNKNHEIMIKDHEVEIYVQDASEPHHSTGVYSILNDEWIITPTQAEFEVSEDDIRKKNEYFTSAIANAHDVFKDGRFEEAYGDVDRLADKLRNYRSSGLESGGEFSVENLVFKSLRNDGSIEELYDLRKAAYDAILSISERQGTL
jgi:predicted nucleotidyltransferase